MKFSPIAVCRIRTWPGPGSPTSTSSIAHHLGPADLVHPDRTCHPPLPVRSFRRTGYFARRRRQALQLAPEPPSQAAGRERPRELPGLGDRQAACLPAADIGGGLPPRWPLPAAGWPAGRPRPARRSAPSPRPAAPPGRRGAAPRSAARRACRRRRSAPAGRATACRRAARRGPQGCAAPRRRRPRAAARRARGAARPRSAATAGRARSHRAVAGRRRPVLRVLGAHQHVCRVCRNLKVAAVLGIEVVGIETRQPAQGLLQVAGLRGVLVSVSAAAERLA